MPGNPFQTKSVEDTKYANPEVTKPKKKISIGIRKAVETVGHTLTEAGSPSSGVETLRGMIYGHPKILRPRPPQQPYPQQPTPDVVQSPVPVPVEQYPEQMPEAQYQQGFPPAEYSHESYYHWRQRTRGDWHGITLPMVKLPPRYRPVRHIPVNPFRQAAKVYPQAGLRGKLYTCPYCGFRTNNPRCFNCGRRIA